MQNDQQILGTLVKRIGSAQWNQWQVQRFQWYDYVQVPNAAAGSSSLSFFSSPLGQADPTSTGYASGGKTIERTNMVKANTFGQQYFILQQIRMHVQLMPKARQGTGPVTQTTYSLDQQAFASALREFLSTGVLNLIIGQKAYFDIVQPMRTAPAGMGVSQVVVPFDKTASSTGNSFVQQSNNLMDVYNLTPPQLIEPEQTFQATLDFSDGYGYNFHNVLNGAAADARVLVGCIFDGYLARPVQ